MYGQERANHPSFLTCPNRSFLKLCDFSNFASIDGAEVPSSACLTSPSHEKVFSSSRHNYHSINYHKGATGPSLTLNFGNCVIAYFLIQPRSWTGSSFRRFCMIFFCPGIFFLPRDSLTMVIRNSTLSTALRMQFWPVSIELDSKHASSSTLRASTADSHTLGVLGTDNTSFTHYDQLDMQRMGKKQELRRSFRFLSFIAFTVGLHSSMSLLGVPRHVVGVFCNRDMSYSSRHTQDWKC